MLVKDRLGARREELFDPWYKTAAGALVPVRIFLGLMFAYAGIDKLSSRAWFSSDDPTSFVYQSSHVVHSSPLRFVADFTAHHGSSAFALGLALTEVAIGVLTLLRIVPRVAAAFGLGMSLMLFFTVSFSVRPVYLGNDLPYALLWVPLVIVSARPVWSGLGRVSYHLDRGGVGRRQVMQGALGLGATLIVSGAAGLTRSGAASRERAGKKSTARSGPVVLPTVAAGEAAEFIDRSGVKSLVVGRPDGTVKAFQATCTHARCIVGFEAKFDAFVCPCHGSTFSAADGRPLSGPAPTALRPADL